MNGHELFKIALKFFNLSCKLPSRGISNILLKLFLKGRFACEQINIIEYVNLSRQADFIFNKAVNVKTYTAEVEKFSPHALDIDMNDRLLGYDTWLRLSQSSSVAFVGWLVLVLTCSSFPPQMFVVVNSCGWKLFYGIFSFLTFFHLRLGHFMTRCTDEGQE